MFRVVALAQCLSCLIAAAAATGIKQQNLLQFLHDQRNTVNHDYMQHLLHGDPLEMDLNDPVLASSHLSITRNLGSQFFNRTVLLQIDCRMDVPDACKSEALLALGALPLAITNKRSIIR